MKYSNIIKISGCDEIVGVAVLQILEVSGGALINPIHYWVTA